MTPFEQLLHSKVSAYLSKITDKKAFLNVPYVIKLANSEIKKWNKQHKDDPVFPIKCFLFITNKGFGKTTKTLKMALKDVKKGEQACLIRNTEAEFIGSATIKGFNGMLNELQMTDHYYVNKNGVNYVKDIDTKTGRYLSAPEIKFLFTTMNSGNAASQFSIDKCRWIIYDEVINRKFNKQNLTLEFANVIQTVQRNANTQIILLGNAHESDNDILNNLAIDWNWLTGTTQVIYRQGQGLLAVYLETYLIKESEETTKAVRRLFQFSEEVQNFLYGKVATYQSYGIINPMTIPDWEQNAKPLWIFDVNYHDDLIHFAVVKYKDEFLYIENLHYNKYPDLPHFAYRSIDKTEYNVYVYKYEDLDTVRALLDWYSNGKVKFKTTFGRQVFNQLILERLKYVLENERKKWELN